jgi:hypothetical protein
MERALDYTALQQTIRQKREGMRADIVCGIEFSIHVVDRDVLVIERRCVDFSLGYALRSSYRSPVRSIVG